MPVRPPSVRHHRHAAAPLFPLCRSSRPCCLPLSKLVPERGVEPPASRHACVVEAGDLQSPAWKSRHYLQSEHFVNTCIKKAPSPINVVDGAKPGMQGFLETVYKIGITECTIFVAMAFIFLFPMP